jgi:hypothetical protein
VNATKVDTVFKAQVNEELTELREMLDQQHRLQADLHREFAMKSAVSTTELEELRAAKTKMSEQLDQFTSNMRVLQPLLAICKPEGELIADLTDYVLEKWAEKNETKFSLKTQVDNGFTEIVTDNKAHRKDMAILRYDIKELQNLAATKSDLISESKLAAKVVDLKALEALVVTLPTKEYVNATLAQANQKL